MLGSGRSPAHVGLALANAATVEVLAGALAAQPPLGLPNGRPVGGNQSPGRNAMLSSP